MRRCVITLILFGVLTGCSREDVDYTKEKAKEAGQELKKEVDEAGKQIKRGLDSAGREIKKELDDDKRDSKTKETSRPAR